MNYKISQWMVAFMILISTLGYAQIANINENKKDLESRLQVELAKHYLVKSCSLQESNTWLSIELKVKTWNNPNDTRALIDSVKSLVKQYTPLSTNSVIGFLVYIDEPKSGFPIAEIKSYNSIVEQKYYYSEYRDRAKAKVFGTKQKSNQRSIDFGRPIMSMWSNVKLYYGKGQSKKYVGKIICFRGDDVLVEFPSGNREWKDRKAIINLNNLWFIDKNDPALDAMNYYTCE